VNRFFKKYDKLFSGLSAMVIIFGVSIFGIIEHMANKRELYIKQLNQVSVNFERTAINISEYGTLDFASTIYNGSDVTLRNVSIIAPERVANLDNGSISLNENGERRGIYLGDIGPSKEISKEIIIDDGKYAFSYFFEIEFQDTRNKWWSKKSGEKPKEKNGSALKKEELKYKIKEIK